jgi:hypothetical protein
MRFKKKLKLNKTNLQSCQSCLEKQNQIKTPIYQQSELINTYLIFKNNEVYFQSQVDLTQRKSVLSTKQINYQNLQD